MAESLPVRDAVLSFAAREPLRAALFLTYAFDGRWFEEALIPDLCDRPIGTMLVVRDRNAIISEAPSVRYRKANACASSVFHPKLILLVAEDKARAVISSANLTRGGFERQRELGRVFNLGPEEVVDRALFAGLVQYLREGVASELRGDAARDLAETERALQAVVERCRGQANEIHILLHNYSESIWSQVLQKIPHRILKRALIVSPFFEPDRQHPEDPPLGPQDASIFKRFLLEDFKFDTSKDQPPIKIFFRQSDGRTELPIRKLAKFRNKVSFFAQDERDQRLHAKLVLLEGADDEAHDSYLLALHGSPNFTTAGLLKRPPHGNSELAVLTVLPGQRKGLERVISALELERHFNEVDDLGVLQSEKNMAPPSPISQGVADVTYHVAEQKLKVSLISAVAPGSRIRVLVQREGTWIVIGEAVASDQAAEVAMPISGIAETDARTNLLEIRCPLVRIDVLGSTEELWASHCAPVNVDSPEDFCGLTMVGPSFLTLDERIARAGVGIPVTYREQLKWLESRKAKDPNKERLGVVSHQADLDRFYRNIHQGLRGILARVKATPGSEFSLRRSLDELTRWAAEVLSLEPGGMSCECRLFLLDRLLRGVSTIMDVSSAAIGPRLLKIAAELLIRQRLAKVLEWLDRMDEPALVTYAKAVGSHASQIFAVLEKPAEKHPG